jgi:hypothetical protein
MESLTASSSGRRLDLPEPEFIVGSLRAVSSPLG